MTEKLKIGIIGTSWWADIIYLPVLQVHERATTVAICGRNKDRADEMAQKYDIPEVYTDYREMIQSADIDALIVSTPDDTHYDMVMAGLDKGLHILCEKPVALNADHARIMYEKAEEKSVKHMVMYTWHWLPLIQRMKQLIDEEYIGNIYHGQMSWLFEHGHKTDYSWRFDGDRSNGVVSDIGSHLIHMAMLFLGDVRAVTANLGYFVQRYNSDGTTVTPAHDMATADISFASGTQVEIFVSTVAHSITGEDGPSIRLDGDKGVLRFVWNFMPEGKLEMTIRGQQVNEENLINETITIGIDDFYKNEPVATRLFVDSILDDEPISEGLDIGYRVQRVIDVVL